MSNGRPLVYDLTGQRYGRLTVIDRAPNQGGKVMWHCLCDCGNVADVRSCSLISGLVRSCGCYHSERAREMMALVNRNRRKP